MKNFKILLIHEFLLHVKSFKFILMLTLSLIITIFTVYFNVNAFNERYKNFEGESIKALNETKKAGTFAELNVSIIIPPNPLSIYSKGFDEKEGNKFNTSVLLLPELETNIQKKNPFMAIFMNLDIVSVVKIILSLMAIFLIADTISTEREEETLKMIFLNNVTRLEYFLAKYFSALIAISVPLIIMFLFSSIYISLQSSIYLTSAFWLKYLLIFTCSLCFLSIFILIGLWISLKATSSAQAMIYGLLIWVLVIFIYPNITNYAVEKIVSVPSSEEVKSNIDNTYNEFGDKLIKDYDEHYPRGKQFFNSNEMTSMGFVNKNNEWVTLPYKEGITSKFMLEYYAAQVKRMIPLLLNYQNKIMDINYRYRNSCLKQKKIASRIQIFMPGYLLDESSMVIAGTNYETRVLNELKKAREYRSVFINYIKSKDGFGTKYFTQIPQNIWSDEIKDYNSVIDKYRIDNYPKLNLNDIPVYPSTNNLKIPLELLFILIVNLLLLLVVSRSFYFFKILNKL